MQLSFTLILGIFLTFESDFSSADSNFVNLQMCLKNQTVTIQLSSLRGDDPRCQCQFKPVIDQAVRLDYIHTPGIGSHKFHSTAKTWNEARKICNEENGHLAIINSQAEAEVLLNIYRKEASKVEGTHMKQQAFVGLHDMFKEGEWLTIFGESIYSTGFAGWSGSHDCWNLQPDNFKGNQKCASFLLVCGKLDDIECDIPLAFFCELPINCT